MAIKVLRIIEYTYADEVSYLADRHRWTDSFVSSMMEMRSTVLTPEAVEWSSSLPERAAIQYLVASNDNDDALVDKLMDLFR